MKLSRPRSSFFPGVVLGLLLMFGLNAVWIHALLGTPMRYLEIPNNWYVLKEQVAQSKEGERLFVLGGSASHYGISARILEEELGVPSVNLATHAGLGLYILDRAKRQLRPGDTVLLILEYQGYTRSATQMSYQFVISRDPKHLRQLSWPDWAHFLLSVELKSLFNMTNSARKLPPDFRWDDPIDDDINAWGDQVGHLEHNPEADLDGVLDILTNPEPDLLTRETIVDFFQWAQANDVRVIATWPTLLFQPEYLEPPALNFARYIKAFYADHGVETILRFQDSLYPKEKFLDTAYHLIEPAAAEHTRRLVPLLRPYFPQTKALESQVDTPSSPGN